jgi:hypothetical protein
MREQSTEMSLRAAASFSPTIKKSCKLLVVGFCFPGSRHFAARNFEVIC